MKDSAKHIAAVGTNLDLGLAALPPSKSAVNRALVLASMAAGESFICWGDGCDADGCGLPKDVQLMCGGLKALGCELAVEKSGIRVFGGRPLRAVGTVNAGDAGTVLRFLLPLAALHCDGPVEFTGHERLFERPLAPLLDTLARLGAKWRPGEGGRVGGVLAPSKESADLADLGREIEIDGRLSSQFISGLAMAVAGLGNGSYKLQGTRCERQTAGPCGDVELHGPTSKGFLQLTQIWLGRFGCEAQLFEGGFNIPAAKLAGGSHRVHGDWGAAAALLCAAAILDSEISVFPLSLDDCQPDSAVLQILERTGSVWRLEGNRCNFKGSLERGIEANLESCPDLAPVLTAAAALAPSVSTLGGLHTLPHKESDRLNGCIRLAEWLGARADLMDGSILKIHGRRRDQAGSKGPMPPFDPHGDHRMAFAAAIGAMRFGGSILNPSCVDKSFPRFWEVLALR